LLPTRINVKIKINKTTIFLVVLYGCKTFSRILREEQRLRGFENRVLRRIFGPKGDEIIESCIKLHYEEIHNLYFSPSIIRMTKSRKMRLAGNAARIGAKRWENQKDGEHWEDIDIDMKLILKLISEK
jgi:hypothetical protein